MAVFSIGFDASLLQTWRQNDVLCDGWSSEEVKEDVEYREMGLDIVGKGGSVVQCCSKTKTGALTVPHVVTTFPCTGDVRSTCPRAHALHDVLLARWGTNSHSWKLRNAERPLSGLIKMAVVQLTRLSCEPLFQVRVAAWSLSFRASDKNV